VSKNTFTIVLRRILELSLPFPYLLLFPFIPHLANGFFDSSGGECLSRAKYPNASFFSQRTSASHRAQGNFFSLLVDLQRISGGKLQFVAKGLGKYNSAGAVYREFHNAILRNQMAFVNVIGNPRDPANPGRNEWSAEESF
jgi:hypothetical protein